MHRLQASFAALLTVFSLMATAQVEDTDAARLAAAEDDAGPEMVVLDLPTPPMTWHDVRITLLNTQDQLVRAGHLKPSLEQLRAALVGGEILTVEGTPVVMRGVLQLRAEGLDWLDIARASAAMPASRRVSGAR